MEIVTARKIGLETTTYVRNIYKYYVAYRLQLDAMEATRKAREHVAPGPANRQDLLAVARWTIVTYLFYAVGTYRVFAVQGRLGIWVINFVGK